MMLGPAHNDPMACRPAGARRSRVLHGARHGRTRRWLLAGALVGLLAACGGDKASNDASTTADEQDATTNQPVTPTTDRTDTSVSETSAGSASTTTVVDAEAIPAMWTSADDFLTAFDNAVSNIVEGNPEAVAIESPVDYPFGTNAEAPDLGVFAWSINDGVTIGGLDTLNEAGNPGSGEVIATVLVAKQANDVATTAMAAYLSIYGEVDAAEALGQLLGSSDGASTVDVSAGGVTIRMSRTGDDPVNDPVIVIRVFRTDQPDVADQVAPAVLDLLASS